MANPYPSTLNTTRVDVSQNKGPVIIATSTISLSLAFIAVFLRMLARRLKSVCYSWEDWLILAASVSGFISTFSITNSLAQSSSLPVPLNWNRSV